MPQYVCTDGTLDVRYTATSAREAAEQYVANGYWGKNHDSTIWVTIYVSDVDEDGEEVEDDWSDDFDIPVHPDPPDCAESEHEWESPGSILGGCDENPGVWGHGGGVLITEVCCHCGTYRHKDTWAQNPNNGRQGLTSYCYGPPDEASTQWVENLVEEEDEDGQ